jgi:hypothetical protein
MFDAHLRNRIVMMKGFIAVLGGLVAAIPVQAQHEMHATATAAIRPDSAIALFNNLGPQVRT